MLIECKIKRPDGTHVPMPSGIDYHFKPESAAPEARHLCEVDNEDDLARFLAIPEGYKIAREDAAKRATTALAPAPAPAAAPAPSQEPKGDGNTAPLPGASTASAPAPKDPSEDSTDGDATDYLIEGDNGEEIDLGKMTRAELEAFAKANDIKLPAVKELKKLEDKALLDLIFKAVTAE